MGKYIKILLTYRITVLICLVFATVFFGFYAGKMKTDNSIEIWLSKNDRDFEYYKTFLKKFGDEEFLVIALSAVDIFTKERIQEINAIAERLKKFDVDGVVSVTSLADVFKDTIKSPLFQEKLKGQKNRSVLNVFKKAVITDPLYQNTLISGNGKTAAVIAVVKSMKPESRKQLVSEIRTLLKGMAEKSADKKHTYHLAGPTVVNAELDRMSKRDMTKLTPFMFVLSLVVLGCLFRRISGVLIPMAMVSLCLVWITGCFVLCGQTMNMISNMLHPLTFIIALSASIHLINHYYYESTVSTSVENAIYNTLQNVGIPILMTTITTIVGFISLATSSIPPVLITGLFMSGCAALTFFMSMICLPVLLSFIPIKGHTCVSNGRNTHYAEKDIKGERAFNTFFSLLGRFAVRYKGITLSCALAAGLFFLWGISKLKVESDIMTSFPKNSQIAKDNNYIESRLMGLLPVEIIAEVANDASILQPGILNNIVTLQRYLKSFPEITNSISVADYIQRTHQVVKGSKQYPYSVPTTEKEATDYVKLASVYGNKYMNSLYSKELRDARISVRMKQVGSSRYQEIINSIKEYIHSHLDTTLLSWHITGIVPLLINVQDNILWSEIQSFSLAFLLTFISTAVALKSVKIGLISIIPNLLPITITLGFMGLTGMKLDAATIMIASIALGISVDNTIHIFYRFKKEISIDGNYSKAVCRTLQGVGKTALFTSLSAAFGFMVFSFSSFKPIQYFGVLTSITILNAIIADLLISPSCLMLFKPKRTNLYE
ncbi:MAG TPA: efflux RND transporter permease subunit [Candidatus Wunengus sp. YC63]|uniref:efflux RND transporter permease subunit n=1 Tax=unclassified Candidatus Wunengus TaxID=3367695 RepID=UPI004026E59B